MRLVAICVVFVAFGCGTGDAEDSDEGEHPVVAAFKRESGFEFEVCQKVRKDWNDICEPGKDPGFACILSAAASCRPAHLHTRDNLGDEGWIGTDYLVVPRGADCEVVRFLDLTHVVDHCRTVTKTTCSQISLKEESRGCHLEETGCGEPIRVAEDPRPKCAR